MAGPPDPRLVLELLESMQKHDRKLQSDLFDCKRLITQIIAATPELPTDPFGMRGEESQGDLTIFDSKIYEGAKKTYDTVRLDSGASMLKIENLFANEISSRIEQVHDQVVINNCVVENPEGNCSEYICGHRIKWCSCHLRARDYCVWMSDTMTDVLDFLACEFWNSLTESLVRIHGARRLSFVDCDFHGPGVTAQGHKKAALRLYNVSDSVIRRCRFHEAGSIHLNGPQDGYKDGVHGNKPIGENTPGGRIQMTNLSGSFASKTCPINIGNTIDVSITDSEFSGVTDQPVWLAADAKRVHIDVMYNGRRFQLEQ